MNRVSTVRFPLSTSTGNIPSVSACIICSQELVELGITKPNLKYNYSISCPLRDIFYSNWKSLISSSEWNTISLETSAHLSSSLGKCTYFSYVGSRTQLSLFHRTFPFSASIIGKSKDVPFIDIDIILNPWAILWSFYASSASWIMFFSCFSDIILILIEILKNFY